MRKTKETTKKIKYDKLLSVHCDFCKKELFNHKNPRIPEDLSFSGTTFEVEFGYGSRFDCDYHQFDICDDCFANELLPYINGEGKKVRTASPWGKMKSGDFVDYDRNIKSTRKK